MSRKSLHKQAEEYLGRVIEEDEWERKRYDFKELFKKLKDKKPWDKPIKLKKQVAEKTP